MFESSVAKTVPPPPRVGSTSIMRGAPPASGTTANDVEPLPGWTATIASVAVIANPLEFVLCRVARRVEVPPPTGISDTTSCPTEPPFSVSSVS